MIRKEVINRHLLDIEVAIKKLKEYQRFTEDDLKSDIEKLWLVEHALQIAIQNLLDIGAHILASEAKNDWDDYAEIIEKLGKYRIIPKEFSEKIIGMAGFRNILIHEYLKVDIEKIYRNLQNYTADFIQFSTYVREYLKVKNQKP